MFDALTSWLADFGVFLAAFTATLVALGTTIRAFNSTGLGKPMRWVWNRLAGDPIREGLERILDQRLAPILAEVKPNGGGSMRDAVKRLEEGQADLVARVDALAEAVAT